ncbi:hypothetical protein AVEN_28078-1 [Araneus ventricosus]|uniref:Uncharacterized protein n=1 Tax=Araneus ventricosus TaxID=182803 RepID=A0A4Y2WHR9_ARAVE|nr:hypothetical protein AVEN_28078-1 [Araneus ventricosus]
MEINELMPVFLLNHSHNTTIHSLLQSFLKQVSSFSISGDRTQLMPVFPLNYSNNHDSFPVTIILKKSPSFQYIQGDRTADACLPLNHCQKYMIYLPVTIIFEKSLPHFQYIQGDRTQLMPVFPLNYSNNTTIHSLLQSFLKKVSLIFSTFKEIEGS